MAIDGAKWDITSPVNADLANEIDDYMRGIKDAITDRMATEHFWPASQSATNEAGMHKYMTFSLTQDGAPSLVIGTNTMGGALFVDSASKDLIFVDSASNSTILVAATGGGGMPSGAMSPFAGTSEPTGWSLCTGGALSRTTYVNLFNVIGTLWGVGDGSTTFNVPDMRGFTVAGKSAAGMFATVGASTGEVTHAITMAEMAVHGHTAMTLALYGHSANSAGDRPERSDNSGNGATSATGAINNANEGSGTAHNNVQPSKVVNFIIKH